MPRDLISSPTSSGRAPGFTLVEVIVAVGILAITALAVVAVQGGLSRAVDDASGYERAAQLVDAVTIELGRLRDRPAPSGQPGRLDALATRIPASENRDALRLVATRDGVRVCLESETETSSTGILPNERYFLVEVRQQPDPLGYVGLRPGNSAHWAKFLVEVRQQPDPLGYVAGAGFLAITLRVVWPYQVPAGPDPALAIAANPAQASIAVFNSALTP